ncbi:MAG: YbhB/YbcL family Raf kinase inhibitor-like protein [Bradymonadaceae bacterium]
MLRHLATMLAVCGTLGLFGCESSPQSAGGESAAEEGTSSGGQAASDEAGTQSGADDETREGSSSEKENETAVQGNESSESSLVLTSAAFEDGETIPEKYTCAGEGASPPISWTGVPDGTESIAVFLEDPDAPKGIFKHWAVFGIEPSTSSLEPGLTPDASGVRQATNDFGDLGYGAPCPPPSDDAHRYRFEVWALDTPELEVGQSPGYEEVREAAEPHTLAEDRLVGTFAR